MAMSLNKSVLNKKEDPKKIKLIIIEVEMMAQMFKFKFVATVL
jgi:hypothetical protein